uniref:Uncharacterized protein n=2 Tax=Peronospora matthiolae TaxID=2874970 RepID=A0AAV1UGE3_9STRA
MPLPFSRGHVNNCTSPIPRAPHPEAATGDDISALVAWITETAARLVLMILYHVAPTCAERSSDDACVTDVSEEERDGCNEIQPNVNPSCGDSSGDTMMESIRAMDDTVRLADLDTGAESSEDQDGDDMELPAQAGEGPVTFPRSIEAAFEHN